MSKKHSEKYRLIGKAISEYRQSRGITQKELADRTGINVNNSFILQHDCGTIPLLITIRSSKRASSTYDVTDGLFWREPYVAETSKSSVSSLYAYMVSTSSTYARYRDVALATEDGTDSGEDWTTDHVNLVCGKSTNLHLCSGIEYKWSAFYAE